MSDNDNQNAGAPGVGFGIVLGLFAAIPIAQGISQWQRREESHKKEIRKRLDEQGAAIEVLAERAGIKDEEMAEQIAKVEHKRYRLEPMPVVVVEGRTLEHAGGGTANGTTS